MIGLHKLRGVDAAPVAHFAGVGCLVAGVGYGTRFATSSVGFGVDPVTVLLLVGVGVSGTIGQVFLTKAYAAGAPTRVSALALTQVIFALAFDVIFWHRPIPAASLLGSVLILRQQPGCSPEVAEPHGSRINRCRRRLTCDTAWELHYD